MNTVIQDVRYALRTLAARPWFTVATLFTLTIGLGANVAMFSIVDGVLLRPLPLKDPDRLVVIWDTNPVLPVPFMVATPPRLNEWQNQRQIFDHAGGFQSTKLTISDNGSAEEVPGASVYGELFEALGVMPSIGRAFVPEEHTPNGRRVVVLSDALWRRRFGGDRTIVGNSVKLSGADYTVVGVMPRDFNFLPSITIEGKPPLERSQFWIPQRVADPSQLRGAHFLTAVGRLREDVSPDRANRELRQVAAHLAQNFPADDGGWSVEVVPLLDQATRGVRLTLLTLLGAVTFVLLLACTNVANLLLARSVGRRKEMAIRAALGAGRVRLARQLFTESLVLSIAGGALGTLLAAWSVRFARVFGPASITRLDEARIDARVLLFASLACVVSAVLFGFAPMIQTLQLPPTEWLKERTAATGRGGARFRSVLVVVEVALALVLLVGGALLLESFARLRSADPGFTAQHAVTFRVALPLDQYPTRAERSRFTSDALRRLASSSGVDAAGAIDSLPIAESRQGTGFTIEGAPPVAPGHEAQTGISFPTPGYFEAIGLPVLRGRSFREDDRTDSRPVIIINQTLARRAFGSEDPVGRTMRTGFNTQQVREIVGVVADEHHTGLTRPAGANVYLPYSQVGWSGAMSFVIRGRLDPPSLTAAARRSVQAIDPGLAIYNVRSIDDIVSASISTERFSAVLLTAFAGAALMLAFVGIYGVTDQAISQRRHELGVRIALGAEPRKILTLVLGEGLRLTVVGVAIGLAGAVLASRFIAALLFGTSPLDPRIYATVVAVLAAATLAAGYVPARRVTRLDPVTALRDE